MSPRDRRPDRRPDPQPDSRSDSRRDRIFEEALGLPPQDREAFLNRACADDAALRTELLSLVRAHEAADGFFEGLARQWISPLRGAGLQGAGMGSAYQGLGHLPPGTRVGRYEIREVLGEGGMGVVYRAHDPALDRDVALKLLPDPALADAGARSALLAEARAVARLDHPHVGVIHEVGETTDAGVFLAMALHEGETLADRLRRGPLPLPTAEALGIGRALVSALEAAHRAGIVHRDLKPANVLLTSGGGIRLVDFGIAAAPGAAMSRRGSRGYASPEATEGGPADPRTDLWSLGVLLHELLTGVRPPSAGAGLPALETVTGSGGVPAEMAEAIEACLAPNPADRPESAAALGQILARVAAATETTPSPDSRTVPLPGEDPAFPSRPFRPTLHAFGAVLGVALLLGGLAWAGARGSGPDMAGEALDAEDAWFPAGGFLQRVLVLPFEDLSGDPEMAAVGSIAADRIIDGISRIGSVLVVESTSAAAAIQETRDPVALAETWRAGLVVTGSLFVDRDSVRLAARLVDGASGALLRTLGPVAAPRDRPLEAIESLRASAATAVAMQVDPFFNRHELLATERPPVWEAWVAYARARNDFAEGRMGLARESTIEAEGHDPTFHLAIFLGAIAAANLGDFPDLEARRDRLKPFVANANPAVRLGFDFLNAILSGSHEESYRIHRRGVDAGVLVPGTMGHAQLVQDAVKLNRPAEAVVVARQVTPIQGAYRGEIRSWAPFWSTWVRAHLVLGEAEEALQVARTAREVLGPTRLEPLTMEMWAQVARGDLAALETVVEEAELQFRYPAEFLLWTANNLRVHGHEAAAIEHYERAIDLARRAVAADPSEAMRRSLALLLLGPEDARAAAEAEALLSELVDAAATRGEPLHLLLPGLGRAAAIRGDSAAAMAWSDRLADLDPSWQFGRQDYERARIAALLDDPVRMVEFLDRANRAGRQVHASVHTDPALMRHRRHPAMAAFLRPR